MKALANDNYIIPVTSINFVERMHGTCIRVYLNSPINGRSYICLQYDDPHKCEIAFNNMIVVLTDLQ